MLMVALACGPAGEEGEESTPASTDAGTTASPASTSAAIDSDNDGVIDLTDNCVFIYNPTQSDSDSNGIGDACDPGVQLPQITPTPIVTVGTTTAGTGTDQDGDGVSDTNDNCMHSQNLLQQDLDNDGQGDACDTCTALSTSPSVSFNLYTYYPAATSSGGNIIAFICAVRPDIKVTLTINGTHVLEESPCNAAGLSGTTRFIGIGSKLAFGQTNTFAATLGAGTVTSMTFWSIASQQLEGKQPKVLADQIINSTSGAAHVPVCLNADNPQ